MMELDKKSEIREKNRLKNILWRRKKGVRQMSERIIPRSCPKKRFKNKIEIITESGCWLWTGSLQRNGHGQMHLNGALCGAHRVAWSLFVGTIPKGLSVLHKCDVRCCVNPDHLFIGTQKENMGDMAQKGRSGMLGEKNVFAKLTSNDVLKIRSDSRRNIIISEYFGISVQTVRDVKSRRSWKHVVESET